MNKNNRTGDHELLNDTEKGLIRMVEEKEEELKGARQQVIWFQNELDKKIVEVEKLRQQLSAKDRVILRMVAELYMEEL